MLPSHPLCAKGACASVQRDMGVGRLFVVGQLVCWCRRVVSPLSSTSPYNNACVCVESGGVGNSLKCVVNPSGMLCVLCTTCSFERPTYVPYGGLFHLCLCFMLFAVVGLRKSICVLLCLNVCGYACVCTVYYIVLIISCSPRGYNIENGQGPQRQFDAPTHKHTTKRKWGMKEEQRREGEWMEKAYKVSIKKQFFPTLLYPMST